MSLKQYLPSQNFQKFSNSIETLSFIDEPADDDDILRTNKEQLLSV